MNQYAVCYLKQNDRERGLRKKIKKIGKCSLVPAISINRYGTGPANQHLHVVWQEEDINNNKGMLPLPKEDAWFSDIAYIRSTNSGLTWAGPGGGWQGHVWDNLTQTPANSQMPSIASILDQHSGCDQPSPPNPPHRLGVGDLGYNSTAVHVSYNENVDINGNQYIMVFYLRSNNDGATWLPRVNVSNQYTLGGLDAYSNIAVDMMDNPHIVFMRNNLSCREPMRTGINTYLPGFNPNNWWSFPGPNPGMYGVGPNQIVYVYNNGAWTWTTWSGDDLEFPTVGLDRRQHINVNWQQYYSGALNDYEIRRVTSINGNTPQYPLVLQNYLGWGAPVNDSNDPANDNLFPNLALKKVAVYFSPNEPAITGFDEIWTKLVGRNPVNSPKDIIQEGNIRYGP